MKLTTLALTALLLIGSAFGQVVTSNAGHKLMIFGGEDHKTYLGCLSCSKYDSDSVLNQYGDHGSRYSSDSIFNRYGDYGSRYSSTSACARYASDPPVIVDEDGGYYGHLTINPYGDRTRNETLQGWIAGVCADH